MRTKIGLILLSISCFSLLIADGIINTSFELPDYSTGTVNGQHNWSVSSGSGVIVTSEDSAATGSQSLNMNTNNALKTLFTPYSSSVAGPTGIIYFDARIRLDALTNKYFALSGYDLYDGSEKRAFVLEFDTPLGSNGAFQAYNGSGKNVLSSYAIGEWNRVSARIDYNSSTYQVIFNGIESDVLAFRESYTPSRTGGEKQFHQLRFNLGFDSATGTVDAFMDDLYMGSDPIPDVTFDEVVHVWTIDVNQPDVGSIVLDPDQNDYDDSSWVSARIELPDGYKLSEWTGDLSGSDSVKTFQITANMSIGADVTTDPLDPPALYTISIDQPDTGLISLEPEQDQYYAYSKVTAGIDVPSGYLFAGWTGDLSGTLTVMSFTITGNMAIGADVVLDTVPATIYTFSSGSAFKDKCRSTSLHPGDIIELTNGTYDTDGIVVTAKGTSQHPIIIRSQNLSGANLSGGSYFDLDEAEYVIIEGFEFSSDVYTAIKLEACNHITIRRNTLHLNESDDSRGKWILVGGVWDDATKLSHHNTIEFNLFEEKHQPGNYITIDGGENVSQHDVIRYNHFKNIGPRVENEMESVRVGVSGMSLTDGFALIEHNLFEGCDGDPEIVSIKSCKDTVRYNTFVECQGTVCLRQGNGTVVDGNFFFGNGKPGTGGVRLYSRDHIIVNNHFQDLTGDIWDAAVTMTNGDVTSGAESAHWQVKNVKVLMNTFVNNKATFEIGYPKADNSWTKVPTDIMMYGNLIYQGDNPAIVYKRTPSNCIWEKNIYFDTDSLMPGLSLSTDQLLIADPFVENASGYYSPAISGPAVGYLSRLEWDTDIRGLNRSLPADAGAVEVSGTGEYLNRPLTSADVGPNAVELIVTGIEDPGTPNDIPRTFNVSAYPNPFNPEVTLNVELFYDSNVKIDIFTLNGRYVGLLSNGFYKAGAHYLTWSPNDLAGGLFLIRITAGNNSRVLKVLYLK